MTNSDGFSKQELAQKRNWFKYILSGLFKPIDYGVLSEHERSLWEEMLQCRAELLQGFDETSKEMGLKVPEYRCWCGKEGKYDPPDYVSQDIKVCKKHRE